MQKQREFPWLAECRKPVNADQRLISRCESESMAVLISVRMGVRHTDAWTAKRLGISRSYLCEIMSGKKSAPEWLATPLAYLTGTWLLAQYRRLQEALREDETEKQRGERIAREYLRSVA